LIHFYKRKCFHPCDVRKQSSSLKKMLPGKIGTQTLVCLLVNVVPSSAIISDIESLLSGSGQSCSVGGTEGLCTYSMLCTFAKGTHLGTCRDRFIFGSCCQMTKPIVEAVEVEQECGQELEEEVQEVCGRRSQEAQEGRIQGGHTANRTSWPWQVGLRMKYGQTGAGQLVTSHHCGAVLLNHNWVATAAHCVYKKNKNKFLILLGDFNNQNDNGDLDVGEMARDVAEIIIHPLYKSLSLDNDLALIKLESPIEFTKYILPICLPTKNLEITGQTGFVTGWGHTSEGGPSPSKLNEVDVPIISNTECKEQFSQSLEESLYPEEDIWVCAGYSEGGKDACDGDSGGPLSIENRDLVTGARVWLLAGIISWGPNGCGEKHSPGVYTRIPSYTQWIQKNIRVNRDGCRYKKDYPQLSRVPRSQV